MQKYRCTVCGYIYDPMLGDDVGHIPPDTSFEEIVEDWPCPGCGTATKLDCEPVIEESPELR